MLHLVILAMAIAGCMAAGPTVKDCHPNGVGKSSVVIKSLSSVPYPPVLPGKIKLSYDIEIKQPVSSFDVNITINKDIGGIKVKVPCIDNIGSCYYSDICGTLDDAFPDGCPILFPECKCPFRAQKRMVRDLEVNLPELPTEIAEIANGKLDITIQLQDTELNEVILACAQVDLLLRT